MAALVGADSWDPGNLASLGQSRQRPWPPPPPPTELSTGRLRLRPAEGAAAPPHLPGSAGPGAHSCRLRSWVRPCVHCLPVHGSFSLLLRSPQCPQGSGVRFSGPGPKRAGGIRSLKWLKKSFLLYPCLPLPPCSQPQIQSWLDPSADICGQDQPRAAGSPSCVSIHLIPRKFLLPYFMPHGLSRPWPGRLWGGRCRRIRRRAAAAQMPHLSLLGFWPSGLLSLELTGHTGGPGPQQSQRKGGAGRPRLAV